MGLVRFHGIDTNENPKEKLHGIEKNGNPEDKFRGSGQNYQETDTENAEFEEQEGKINIQPSHIEKPCKIHREIKNLDTSYNPVLKTI